MSKIKILIVEDDINIHELYDFSLGDDMFEKRFTDNGKDALDIYESWHPDIIVLDIWMPVITGYTVLQEIRMNLKDLSTTIIMSTSASNSHDIEDCIKFGIQGYLIKPFKLQEIGNKIIQYFQRQNAARLQ